MPSLAAPGSKCALCLDASSNDYRMGHLYALNPTTAFHHYCLLFSSGLSQCGEDEDGIFGFLEADINKEMSRGRRLHCCYCNKTGATIGCVNKKCRRSYHMWCGLQNSAQFSFSGEFRTLCQSHRSYQRMPEVKADCPICMEEVNQDDKDSVVWAPCCRRNDLFHKLCVQRLALSAGYFFKCPLCNDKDRFTKAMQDNGIYVPEQDASWELEPNAYQDLLERPVDCVAPICLCPFGRSDSKLESSWELTFCQLCGSQAIHTKCQALVTCSSRTEWHCVECTSLLADSAKRERTQAKARHQAQRDLNAAAGTSAAQEEQSHENKAMEEPRCDAEVHPRTGRRQSLQGTNEESPSTAEVRPKKEPCDDVPVFDGDGESSQPGTPGSTEKVLIELNANQPSCAAAALVKNKKNNKQERISRSKMSPEGSATAEALTIGYAGDGKLPNVAVEDVQSASAEVSRSAASVGSFINGTAVDATDVEIYLVAQHTEKNDVSFSREYSMDNKSLGLRRTVSRTSTPKRKASDHSEEEVTSTPKRWTPSFNGEGRPDQKENQIYVSGYNQGDEVDVDSIIISVDSQLSSPLHVEDESKMNGISPTGAEHKEGKASCSKLRDHANDSKNRRPYHRKKDLFKTTQISITNFFSANT